MDEIARPVEPPPLTRWQWAWRNVVVVAAGAAVGGPLLSAAWDQNRLVFWLDLCAGVSCLVLYQYRRRSPFPVVLLVNVVGAIASTAVGTVTLALVSLATRRRWREILPVAAVNVAGGLIFFRVQPTEGAWFFDVLLTVVAAGAAVAIGMYIGARRELVATLQDRAERAENEQALRVAQARANERARIAREMHDVLAHRISLVAMHAGALGYRTDLTPAEAARAAGVIQDNAHRALIDLREILGVLREGLPDGAPEAPQPTLRELPALITDERNAGAKIRLRTRIRQPDAIPETVGRNAYRILQESLTNARKHAPGTDVDVIVAGSPGGSLILLVRNPLPVGRVRSAPGARLGLVGLSERASLAGGTLDHRVTRHGHFVVRARLPWPG